MRQVTVTRISDYRRPYEVPYKVIVQPIAPSSLLQRMTEAAAVYSTPRPGPVFASVTPIDSFRAGGSR
jgi:hypothetical protein